MCFHQIIKSRQFQSSRCMMLRCNRNGVFWSGVHGGALILESAVPRWRMIALAAPSLWSCDRRQFAGAAPGVPRVGRTTASRPRCIRMRPAPPPTATTTTSRRRSSVRPFVGCHFTEATSWAVRHRLRPRFTTNCRLGTTASAAAAAAAARDYWLPSQHAASCFPVVFSHASFIIIIHGGGTSRLHNSMHAALGWIRIAVVEI